MASVRPAEHWRSFVAAIPRTGRDKIYAGSVCNQRLP